MTPCDVKATFNQNGDPRPQQITWDGETLTFMDTGRRWVEDGGQHILARTFDGRVFELLYYHGIQWRARVVSTPSQSQLS